MDRVQDYLQQAKECRESATKANSPRLRDHFLEMAEHWESLARQRIAQQHLEDIIAGISSTDTDDGKESA